MQKCSCLWGGSERESSVRDKKGKVNKIKEGLGMLIEINKL